MALHGRGSVGLTAFVLLLAGCVGGPVGTAPPDRADTPTHSPTSTVDPAEVLDHGDVASTTAGAAVAAAVDANGSTTRDGSPTGLEVLDRYRYVNYLGACYEVSTYPRIVYQKDYESFRLRNVSGTPTGDGSVVAYDALPPVDRRAVDEVLAEGEASAYVGRAILDERDGSTRYVETASVVTEYGYVERGGVYYAVEDVTSHHHDIAEVLATTVVVEQVRDEPCPTD